MTETRVPTVNTDTWLFPQRTMDALAAFFADIAADPEVIEQAVEDYFAANPIGLEFQQSTPEASWTVPIPASLGRAPSVTVYAPDGEQIEPDINIIGTNVIVVFAAPATGTVVLI